MGGLLILRALVAKMPDYEYFYLGDTKRVPYGNRSPEAICEFTQNAVDYLICEGCGLIILACNTASSVALKKIQREYLPGRHPEVRVLGVIVPTAEAVCENGLVGSVGVLATSATVASNVFPEEFLKLAPGARVFQQEAPLLVPLIENNSLEEAKPVLRSYLENLRNYGVRTVVLGCTHYPVLKKEAQEIMGERVKIISQDEIIPEKTAIYLARHPEIERRLKKNGKITFAVTDFTENFRAIAERWFGKNIELKPVNY